MVDIIKKKLIPTVIIFVLILSSFCFSVYAEDEENLVSENLSQWYVESFGDGNGPSDFYYNSNTSQNTLTLLGGNTFSFIYYTLPSFSYNHTFQFDFDIRGLFNRIPLTVELYNDNTGVVLASYNTYYSSNYSCSIVFTPSSYFSSITNLKLGFKFDGTYDRNLNFYISNISLTDISGSSSDNLSLAINNYIRPSFIWFISQASNFFDIIESQWYYLFIWYILNSAVIISVVVYSVFDWIDIFSEGMLSFTLFKRREAKRNANSEAIHEMRLKESEKRYEMYRANKVQDWEVRNFMSKQKEFMTFAEAKKRVIELKKSKEKTQEKNNKSSDDK